MQRKVSPSAPPALPHSWTVASWPATVYPGDVGKAKYLIRVHKDELLKAGALARVGRELCVFGTQYERWLQRQAHRAPDYVSAANLTRNAQV